MVTVVGLGLVSVEVWERTKCETGYVADYIFESEKRETTETATERGIGSQFHLIAAHRLASQWYFK